MKVLVAGAAGFIGRNLIERLSELSDLEVIGVVNRENQRQNSKNIRYIRADLQSYSECRRIVEGVNQVFMVAGRVSPIASMSDDLVGPVRENTAIHINMLDACWVAGVNKYLWLNSTTGYPDVDYEMSEDDYFNGAPPSVYEPAGWMWRYIDKLAEYYAVRAVNPMTVITLRPTAVYGKYDDFDFRTCHALPAMIRKVVERQCPIEIWGSGEDRKDWLYVDDLMDACLLAMDQVDGYEALNIGSGQAYSLNELLAIVMELEELKSEVVHNMRLHKSQALVRKFNIKKAEHLIGYRPRTPVRSGILSTIKWYKSTALKE